MSRKKENIVTHSEAELRAMNAAGQTRSDWKNAAQLPVPGAGDPDDAMEPVDWATTALPMPKRKEHTNLRIDADVMEFFRNQGKGYQTRINSVLRAYVEQMTRRETR
ncbi:MAG: BrnA antitoxin family protein [Methylocystis sp.]